MLAEQLVHVARDCWLPKQDLNQLVALCAAVVASSADDSLVVGVTAARLYGLWLPDVDQRVHIATAVPEAAGRSMTRTRRPQFVAHRRQLPPQDRTTIHGVPASTMGRTWRDLAALLALADVVAAGDSALRAGTAVEELVDVTARTSGGRGARRPRAALPLLDARSRSRPESHLRVAVSAGDLPRFEVNKPVRRRDGGWLAEPDLSLEAARIALEYQGSEHAKLRRMRRDLTRFTDMRQEGWLCLPYGPAEVFARPWQIDAEVRAEVRIRAPHLLRPRRRSRVVTLGASGQL